MGIINILKWLWDPRTEEQKRYETDPLRFYKQNFVIYIKGVDEPFKRYIDFEDRKFGDFILRVDLEDDVHEWLDKCAKRGIRFDNVWYPPDQILRIEIGEHTVEEIQNEH
jgi:hypothetical protein